MNNIQNYSSVISKNNYSVNFQANNRVFEQYMKKEFKEIGMEVPKIKVKDSIRNYLDFTIMRLQLRKESYYMKLFLENLKNAWRNSRKSAK